MCSERTASPIAAIATAPGAAGVSVVRISGEGSLELGDRLVPSAARKPSARESGTFFHASVFHPLSGEKIDDAVLLVYRSPHSYTGEDALEIQGHGGGYPSRRLLDAVLAAGARLAEPGEFTKRAFLNGRLDLTQAEALCDFIQSKTERAAQVARSQLDGSLGRLIGAAYERMVAVCAEVEHLLDFDEGELPGSFADSAEGRVRELVRDVERLSATWNEGHLLRDGALVVISGKPNAGKSSLLNALLGRERAIVHHVPGTTRDVIEEGFVLNGVPLRLVDTAGLRETGDEVERQGISRARALMAQADLNIHVVDPLSRSADDCACDLAGLDARRTVIGLSKSDVCGASPDEVPGGFAQVRFSSVTGEGLEELKTLLGRMLSIGGEAHGNAVVSLRQVTELRAAADEGRAAAGALAAGQDRLVIAAGHLRQAAEALGRIVGRVYSDDLLEAVFSRFCVGK